MRLLIVGTLKGQLTTATKIAMDNGASVTHAEDHEQAMRVLRGGKGADLLLVDVALDIRDLVMRLEAEHIHVPIVACGISNDARAAVAAIHAGAKEYIPLPPDPELIAAVLAAVANDSRDLIYRDEAMAKVIKLAQQIAGSDASVMRTRKSHESRRIQVLPFILHARADLGFGIWALVFGSGGDCFAPGPGRRIRVQLRDYCLFNHQKKQPHSADGRSRVSGSRSGRPDQDGRYRIAGLPPGRYYIVAVDHLDLVCNGRVVRSFVAGKPIDHGDFSGSIALKDSGWCVARASSDAGRYPVLDTYVYATTSPIYATVGGRKPRSPDDARYFAAWIDRVTEATAAYPDWNNAAEKRAVLERLQQAKGVFVELE